jgi:sterol desaturase/sphingolipid hydroxylase (fatty acid hydroxylase superfamily)
MTYGLVTILGILQAHKGKIPLKGRLFSHNWSGERKFIYNYLIGAHTAHVLDFSVALIFYLYLFPGILEEAKEFRVNWILKIFLYNIPIQFCIYEFYHWLTYIKCYEDFTSKKKFNSNNPYGETNQNNFFQSSSGHLEREICFSTLGFIQASVWECIMIHLWATGLPYEKVFMERPIFNIVSLLFVTFWREFHFYWCHRFMHPWWKRENGLKQGDIGAFLYRHFHSLHHKSYNPGPWSGLSMHPVEHFFYFTCTLIPLFVSLHPLHYLYCKFHANISPIGGHDGLPFPGGDSAFHWLHHATSECNYGVPLVDMDILFGTKVEYEDYIRVKTKTEKVMGLRCEPMLVLSIRRILRSLGL